MYEFRFGGEMVVRPSPDSRLSTWIKFFYSRRNVAGNQTEWWYHVLGCRKWFVAERDTTSNQIHSTKWPIGNHAFRTTIET